MDPTRSDEFYILARAARIEHSTRVLKQGETFAVFDHFGDIHTGGMGDLGLYHEGTRYVSRLDLQLSGGRPLLFLSSTIHKGNELMAVDLMNPDILMRGSKEFLPRGVLHLFRSTFLLESLCYQRLRISNYGLDQVIIPVSFHFEADFSDIFEVRGTQRKCRGRLLEALVEKSRVVLSYEGLDRRIRQTCLQFFPEPDGISSSRAEFEISLQPKQETVIYVTVSCECKNGGISLPAISYERAFGKATEMMKATKHRTCEIYTSNEQFNEWLDRSFSDLFMMLTGTPHGVYPYAGVPWFSTAFGRDGIITALQSLWVDREIARGVLSFLASTQAKEVDPERDAEPGKILHETRKGEMAELREIPFGRYYGTVDATPLFLVLAGEYYESTADLAFIRSIWPNVELALNWIDRYGDEDGDGFVEYARHSADGLVQQGWKDSHDSVFYEDGNPVRGPVALCEVQGYVYDAKRKAARLASLLGYDERAAALLGEAQALKERFEKAFWCEDLFTYALALDGEKRQCRVRASNAGHCLFSGICSEPHARSTAQTLMSDNFFSGWGIRTLATSEALYNPMSYHNGSVWPHDNSLIACGMSRYGLKNACIKILSGLFSASRYSDLFRLPELFCGFLRRPGQGPTLYPVACAPQSWAVGTPFLLLQSCLGLTVHAEKEQLRFTHSQLPDYLQEVHIRKLKVGAASVDIIIRRHAEDVTISVPRREGPVEIVVVK